MDGADSGMEARPESVCHLVRRSSAVSTDGISPQNTDIESPPNTGHNVSSPLITTEEGRMLRKEDFMVIHALAQRGLYVCDIATQVGVHPRTVRRALARGGAPAPRPS